MPEEGIELTDKSELMTIEEILDIAQKFVQMGVKKIRLTGGEPLVRKNVEYLLRELGKLPVELAITTNGVVVDKFIDIFKEIGLNKINISLDSLNKEKAAFITKRDYFDRIMTNIDLLVENDFNVKANVVLIKGVNHTELLDFIEFTKNRNIALRFIEFMPFAGNNWDWEKAVSLAETLEIVKAKYGDRLHKKIDEKNDTSLNYQIDGFEGSFGVISSVTNPFCGTCNRIRLTANGRIKNCLFSDSETDILTSYRAGLDLENIIRNTIFEKKSERGGMDTMEKLSNPDLNGKNRSMIAIGG